MDEYTLDVAGMAEVMGPLSRLLNIRVTFFDRWHREIPGLDCKATTPYCRRRRRVAAFDARCRACDEKRLEEARRFREAMVYRCHAGLLEGVTPLCDRNGLYLGSIVFGQARPRGQRPAGATERETAALRETDEVEMREMARLLAMVSAHILERELVRYRPNAWLRRVKTYLNAHWREKVTLAALAKAAGCSPSWLSHHFSPEFGLPLRAYLRQRRLEEARRLLDTENLSVQDAAERTGFYDAFHLSMAFKAQYGHSPREHRRR